MNIPPKDQVTIGRLRKKIERLIKQRDYLSGQLEHFKEVIAVQPFIESRYRDYTKAKEDREHVQNLERRCKEQAMLIRMLTGDNIPDFEIENRYAELIKQENLIRQLKKSPKSR